MNRSLVIICAAVALTTGCGMGVTNSEAPEQPGGVKSPASSAKKKSTAPKPSASPSSLTKRFGSTFTWDDGVAVTVGKGTPFTSGPYAAPASTKGLLFTVTVTNGSKEPVNPMLINLQATSGQQQAEAIFDSEQGIDLPTADVLPGRSTTYKAAFSNPSAPFTMQVNYGINATGYYE